MRLLICGSRTWTDREAILDVLGDYLGHGGIEVLHGAARGADSIAADVAEGYGYAVRAFPPDYARHGRGAPLKRNIAMLDERPDLVIAFDMGTSGTAHTIREAEKRGIPVEVHLPAVTGDDQ